MLPPAKGWHPAGTTANSDSEPRDRGLVTRIAAHPSCKAHQILSICFYGQQGVAGVTAYYGEANSDVRSIFGGGSLKTQGYGLGATLTWYGLKGFYINGQAQFSRYDSDLKSHILGRLAQGNDGDGEVLTLELCKRTSVAPNLSVTPQIQMVYSYAGFDRFTDPARAIVAADKGDGLKSRWSI